MKRNVKQMKINIFIQLSDLHLGTKKTDNGLIVLQDSLDELYHMLPHDHQLNF